MKPDFDDVPEHYDTRSIKDSFSQDDDDLWQIDGSQRFFLKNGNCNFTFRGISKKNRLFFADIFTTLIDSRWRNLILIFFSGFILSWIIFSLMWFSIIHIHGDIENLDNENWQPCVSNIKKFESVLLFSMETQTTIGYGSRYVTEKCSEAVVLLIIQSVFGAMLQALLAGILLARIQVPKLRAKTLLFSRFACISLENEELCLTVRMGNMRRSTLVGAHVRAVCVFHKQADDGEQLPTNFYELDVGFETGNDRLMLLWPDTVVHVINEKSPFWGISRESLLSSNIELIMILEGSVEHNSNGLQGRASYLPMEILWGRKFFTIVDCADPKLDYKVDFRYFNDTLPAPRTPDFSAKELSEWKQTEEYSARERLLTENKTRASNPLPIKALRRGAEAVRCHLKSDPSVTDAPVSPVAMGHK